MNTAATVTTASPRKNAQFEVSRGEVYTCVSSSMIELIELLVLWGILDFNSTDFNSSSSDLDDVVGAGACCGGSGEGGGVEDICYDTSLGILCDLV